MLGDDSEMDVDDLGLQQTIRFLYEGEHVEPGCPLANDCVFTDPIVIVEGRAAIIKMFRRLNRLFPASQVVSWTPISSEPGTYQLLMYYRRKQTSRPNEFKTRVEITVVDGQLSQIVEHWTGPVSFKGDSRNPAFRVIRGGLGKILSW
tara:strand:+ start:240 stop:683 length:444 start_codon:yes stop_codon:yes gene_type:complete